LALLGAFLTYKPMLGLVLLSSFQGSVVGLTLLAVRGRAGPAPQETVPDPTSETASSDEEDDWEPGPTNMPFGPWLALSGLEILLLGPWLWDLLPPNLSWFMLGSPGGP
jgi:leader peptidase (prepilin peptidase)/N-methyltransferase